jgi:hypothetical protein
MTAKDAARKLNEELIKDEGCPQFWADGVDEYIMVYYGRFRPKVPDSYEGFLVFTVPDAIPA